MSTKADIGAADGWFVAEDKSLRFTIFDDADVIQNITGWTIQFKLAATLGGAPVVTKSATLTTPASGVCTVAIASGDTSGLSPGVYFYTLRRTDGGARAELAYGSAELLALYTT